MTQIAAIETSYAGCRFRSRLEARWAVFFDTLRIPWEYEPQGYEIKSLRDSTTRRYLPDFYLPTLTTDRTVDGTYVEVKGSDTLADDNYRDMISSAIDYQATPISKGLLLLGQIPDLSKASLVLHSHLRWWNEGVESRYVNFAPHRAGDGWELDERHYWHGGWISHSTAPDWPQGAGWGTRVVYIELPLEHQQQRMDGDLKAAYSAARSARFEHGETPTPRLLPSKPPTLGAVVHQPAADAAQEALEAMAAVGRCTDAIIDLLREHSGEELSTRQIVDALRTRDNSYREVTIRRALSKAASDHLIEWLRGPRATHLWRISGTELVVKTFGGSSLVEGEQP